MFLMKTKNQNDYVLQVFRWIGYDNNFLVSSNGLSGGLALFWKKDVKIDILASSPNFIDTRVHFLNHHFYLTFVYGAPARQKRLAIWNKLSELGEGRDSSWLLTGDFNDILDQSKKRGGPPRHEVSFIDFRNFVSQNGLWDVKHTGNPLLGGECAMST